MDYQDWMKVAEEHRKMVDVFWSMGARESALRALLLALDADAEANKLRPTA
jgi:hypothetical protein